MTKKIVAVLLGTAMFGLSMSSLAGNCPAPFDIKESRWGEQYGDCRCPGAYLGYMTPQQCNAAVAQWELGQNQGRMSQQDQEAQRRAEALKKGKGDVCKLPSELTTAEDFLKCRGVDLTGKR